MASEPLCVCKCWKTEITSNFDELRYRDLRDNPTAALCLVVERGSRSRSGTSKAPLIQTEGAYRVSAVRNRAAVRRLLPSNRGLATPVKHQVPQRCLWLAACQRTGVLTAPSPVTRAAKIAVIALRLSAASFSQTTKLVLFPSQRWTDAANVHGIDVSSFDDIASQSFNNPLFSSREDLLRRSFSVRAFFSVR